MPDATRFAAFSAERSAPHSVEAEQAVLGCLLIGGRAACAELEGALSPSDFHLVKHGWICAAARECFENGQDVDTLTVSAALERQGRLAEAGGSAYLIALIGAVPSAVHARSYAEIVRGHALRRRGLQAASDAAREIYASNGNLPEVLGRAAARFDGIAARPAASVHAGDAGWEWYDEVRRWVETGQIPGLSTGYPVLDRKTHGLKRGKLQILAGRPSMGKSSLAFQINLRQARLGLRIGIFSHEMPRGDVVGRMALAETNLDKYRLAPPHLERLEHVLAEINLLPITICDQGQMTAAEIAAEAREMKRRLGGLDVVVVDHLGYVLHAGAREENTATRIGHTTKSLARLAKDLDCAVLALSQLSRAVLGRANKEPNLEDLRDSGHVEQDARMVWFLHRPDYYADLAHQPAKDAPQKAFVVVAKNDDGPRGVAAELAFVEQSARFAEWLPASGIRSAPPAPADGK